MMRVDRFSLGFGPALVKWRSGDTEFIVGPIPFGGYVQIAGMTVAEEIDRDDETAYPNRPVWQRFLTIFAGPGTNYLFAVVLGFGLYAAAGVPSGTSWWKIGDTVEIVGMKDTSNTVVTGVEMFHKLLDTAEPGDAVGVLIRGVDRDEVERGQVLAAPGSITPHTEYDAQVYVLSKDEGGRHTPFFNGYKPQFYIRTTDVTGEIVLPEGVEMVMPGDNIVMGVKLIMPVAIVEQLRFAVREGGRTVGSGVITEVKR